jgi:hypothetical protein
MEPRKCGKRQISPLGECSLRGFLRFGKRQELFDRTESMAICLSCSLTFRATSWMRGKNFTEAYERAQNIDVDLNGSLAAQNT